MEQDNVVSEEVAEQEFERFVKAMDLDVEQSAMDQDERRDFTQQKRTFVRAVMSGKLSVNDNGEPVFKPSEDEEPLTFYEPTGAVLMELDQAKQGQNVRGSVYLMAAMTHTSKPRFANMRMRDFKVCGAILAFFMGG